MFCGVITAHNNIYSPNVMFKSVEVPRSSEKPQLCLINLPRDMYYPPEDNKNPNELSSEYKEIRDYINNKLDYSQFDIRRAYGTLKNYKDENDYHTYIINYKNLVNSGKFRAETITAPYKNDKQVDTGSKFAMNEKSRDIKAANTNYKILIAKALIAMNNLDEYNLDLKQAKKYNLSKVTKDEKFALLVVHLHNIFKELSKNYIEISKSAKKPKKAKLAEDKAEKAFEYGEKVYTKIFYAHFPKVMKRFNMSSLKLVPIEETCIEIKLKPTDIIF